MSIFEAQIDYLRSFMSHPGFSGTDDGLRTVGDLQLGEDVGDVVAHGLLAEVKPSGDLGVCLVAGDELQDLALAVGELGEGLSGHIRTRRREIVHEAPGDGRTEDGLAARDGPYGAQNFGF